MKLMKFLYLFWFLLSSFAFSQEDLLAKEYFNNGDFEKAVIAYQKLYDKSPNTNYLIQLVKSHQQLEHLDEAEQLLMNQISKSRNPVFLVELGYNYQLKSNITKANTYYDQAISLLDDTPNYAYSLGRAFEDRSLLDQAIVTYEKAIALNPALDNLNIQLARIYGEQGNVQKLFESYLNFIETNDTYVDTMKRAFSDFITEDPENENNQLLRRTLLKKIQMEPNLLWNEMLSWLFVQQKEYHKAFAQEKAIFNRNPESLARIEELASIAYSDQDFEKALEIYSYLQETAQDIETRLKAFENIIEIKTETLDSSEYPKIQKEYQEIFETFGVYPQTLSIQISYAHFLAFYMHQSEDAIAFLKKSLELPVSDYQKAQIKMELADILVQQERFNEALINYTQIQRNLKNSTLSQEARYKVAKTSYYKGDFNWAESQLGILKSSTSQLIANDALDLMLLIRDNKFEDSTQAALKLYAKADLMAFQNHTDTAIELLSEILEKHKGKSIEDQALFMQAKLFTKKKQYDLAIQNYQSIITHFGDDILADDAYFNLAELYNNILEQPEKAKMFYENIVFNYEDSIYFVDARKAYRLLRGDDIN